MPEINETIQFDVDTLLTDMSGSNKRGGGRKSSAIDVYQLMGGSVGATTLLSAAPVVTWSDLAAGIKTGAEWFNRGGLEDGLKKRDYVPKNVSMFRLTGDVELRLADGSLVSAFEIKKALADGSLTEMPEFEKTGKVQVERLKYATVSDLSVLNDSYVEMWSASDLVRRAIPKSVVVEHLKKLYGVVSVAAAAEL